MVKIRDSKIKRIFYANGCEINKNFSFPSNYLSTTRYTLITFIPFSLFIQFRRLANIYFLVIAVLQSISYISPLQPFSAVAPLVFVISVSMIREAIEDYLRYRSDKESNSMMTMFYKNGGFIQTRYQDIEVGNIVLVKKDQAFPCDLIMLSNSNENFVAYIETSSIDGEKNLKTRQALLPTSTVIMPESVIRMFSQVECDEPNSRIYQFIGTIDYMDKKYSLDRNNLLLAGAILRNTHWAIGIATYTGTQTKLRMNLMGRRNKQSKIERLMNNYLVYIISLQIILCLLSGIFYGIWAKNNYSKHNYLGPEMYNNALEGFLTFFTYFLLLNTMLPISLIISLELLKLVQGFFMQQDINLYSYLKDRPCKVSSFSLNEELGMVEHIFTDKTGTLTCNKMKFKYCSIGEKIYGELVNPVNMTLHSLAMNPKENKSDFNCKELQKDWWSTNSPALFNPMPLIKNQREIIDYFLKCMALCHECLIEDTLEGVSFTGQSPDEITLLQSAWEIGVKYSKNIGGIIELIINQGNKIVPMKYEKICMFEFDSDRKRNSIVVRELETSKYFLFIKGADNIMAGLLSKANNDYLEKVSKDLLGFSEKGFRTLILGYKVIEPLEFDLFKVHYDEASTSVDFREEKIKKIAEMIECDINLLGCTAVEDSLQDEVPETIQDILNAGINIWMLTGDKLETAVNIGKTCSLLNDNMLIERCPALDYVTTAEALKKTLKKIESVQDYQESAIVIEGAAIEYIINTPVGLTNYQNDMMNTFLRLSDLCKTVICCRVTPGQKKDIVKIIKNHKKCVALAIGDGANDVSMILEAQVGIGIYGEEGMQSVQASDYAIGEFKYLWELLFIHGRFNYIRQSEMILYFIYKNLVFTLPQFYFSFYCAFSGQTVYDDWYITVYNMILTALPLFIKGLFEKDINIPTRNSISSLIGSDYLQNIRSQVPYVYITSRKNLIFTKSAFLYWMYFGVFHSCIVFFIPLYAGSKGILDSKGHNMELTCFSITSFSCVIMIVNLKLSLTTRFWNMYHLISIILFSIILYIGFILIYDVIGDGIFCSSIIVILSNYYFYICIFVCFCWVCVFDGALLITQRIVSPKNSEILMGESVNEDYALNR